MDNSLPRFVVHECCVVLLPNLLFLPDDKTRYCGPCKGVEEERAEIPEEMTLCV